MALILPDLYMFSYNISYSIRHWCKHFTKEAYFYNEPLTSVRTFHFKYSYLYVSL